MTNTPATIDSGAGLAFNFAELVLARLRTTTNTVPLPQFEPRAMGLLLVVPSIGSREVARSQRPLVWQTENALQTLDFGNRLFWLHRVHHLVKTVVRSNRSRYDCLMTHLKTYEAWRTRQVPRPIQK